MYIIEINSESSLHIKNERNITKSITINCNISNIENFTPLLAFFILLVMPIFTYIIHFQPPKCYIKYFFLIPQI